MDFLTHTDFWSIGAKWLQLVLLDLCLAGDNALVIALAVRRLPERQQFWGRMWGTVGAVILRIVFISAVSFVLRVPLLRLAGGAVLFWIAIKLLRGESEGNDGIKSGSTLNDAVRVIILADVVMSLDNVLAISGAAQGDIVLVLFGLLLSIPLVVWGSGLLARLMDRVPIIIWLGGGVLAYVAVELMMSDEFVASRVTRAPLHALAHAAPLVAGAVLFVAGWWFAPGPKPAKDDAPNSR